jgi:hypothetical protein
MTRSKIRGIFSSPTFWINITTLVYVLVTGDIEAFKKIHMNDHLTITFTAALNFINVIRKEWGS